MQNNLVHKSFLRSINTYEEHALVQKEACNKLLSLIIDIPQNSYEKVLEIGCGTGMMTRSYLTSIGINQLFLNDLVPEMEPLFNSLQEEHSRIQYQFISGDITDIELPKELDLIISASTFQWISKLKRFFKKLSEAMNPGARVIFNSYGPLNLIEIKTLNENGLKYKSRFEIESIASNFFEVEHSSESKHMLNFDTPFEVLRHFRLTGVNGISSKQWTKTHLKNFEDAYNNLFSTENGVSLTYHPLYFVLKKK